MNKLTVALLVVLVALGSWSLYVSNSLKERIADCQRIINKASDEINRTNFDIATAQAPRGNMTLADLKTMETVNNLIGGSNCFKELETNL